MKKILFSLVFVTVSFVQGFSQCGTPVASISENFDGAFPACWFTNTVSHSSGFLYFNTGFGNAEWIVLPMVDNAKGILEFDALNATNGQAGPGSFEFGVSSESSANSMASFELVEAQNIYYAASGGSLIYTHHVIDFSDYTGTGQYIVIWLNGSTSREMRLDNITYTSACFSQSVTALAQDITVQLNEYGNANVNPGMVDNGSTSDCGTPTLSLSQSQFDCSDAGVNQVMFTADDGSGRIQSIPVNITVIALIDDETVSAAQTNLCSNGSTTISTGSSNPGISYYLRNDADNSIVAGPLTGTGNPVVFNTGTVSSNTTFNVYADIPTPTPSYAVDLDGTNDYINAPISPTFNYEQGFTFEAKLKHATGGSRTIFSAGTANTSDIEIYVQGGSNWLTVVYNRASPGYVLSGKLYNIPPVNVWYHLAVTYDGANTRVYYDGVEQSAVQIINGSPLHKTAGAEFDFGFMRSDITGGNGFVNHQGSFDEIRIWNDARTTVEIQSLMNECSDGSGSGLVALFPLNDGPGLVAADVVGGNNGTLVNMDANTDWVASPFPCGSSAIASSAVDLDGTNDYINAAVPSYFDYSQGFTFEARLKANAGGSRAIFSAGTTSTSDIEVYVQGTTNKLVVVYNRNSPGYVLAAKEYAATPFNTWFHLAVTYDGTSTKVYYNGVEQNAVGTTVGSPLHKTVGTQFDFGYMRIAGIGFITHLGAFDEIRLWDDARTAGEILASKDICSDGTGDGLISVYPFNEGNGTVANDIVGGNHGALVNMTPASDWVAGPFACSVASSPTCVQEMTQTVTVTVGDALAPVADVASLPNVTAQCEVTSLTAPTATDACAGSVTGTHNASLPISTNQVITWTYSDGTNLVTQEQEVVIADTENPVADELTLPTLTAYCQVDAPSPPTATDNCSGALTATTDATFPILTDGVITWTWIDASANEVTQTQEVVITDIDVTTAVNGSTITANQLGATYHWFDCSDPLFPLDNDDDGDFVPDSPGNYAVEVTINGCTETSDCVAMTVTGINENNAVQLNIFPVPATEQLNVVCSQNVVSLNVYAVSGQLVASYPQNTKTIDVSGLSNGMYLLMVQTEIGMAQTRFVKE